MTKTDLEWTGKGHPGQMWVLDPRAPGVSYRGLLYPERIDWTWTRSDGLVVSLEIEVDPNDGPIPLVIRIEHRRGITSDDYRQPIASMTRNAAASYAIKATSSVGNDGRPVFRLSPGRMTGRTDHDRLRRVAGQYKRAIEDDRSVTTYIEEEEHVSRSTAYGLIHNARQAGILPATKRGRKSAR